MTDSTDNARGPKFPADWRDRAHSFKGVLKLQAAWADGFNAARDQIRADLASDPMADPRVVARMIDALRYYADPKTYEPDKTYANQPWPIFDDEGALARAALAVLSTGGNADG